jgi:FkbM family methyltransferase
LNIFREDKYLVRRLTGAIIGRSGLGRLLKIKIRIQDYYILFHPTGLANLYWNEPKSRIEDFKFITSFLKKGDTYIDIGANIGVTVIPAAKSIGIKGICKAFEPHPRIFSYLKENLRLNDLKNVEVYNFALGDLKKDVYLTDNFTDEVNNVVEEPHQTKSISIQMRPLDAFTEELETINLLKIDVEGYEKFVLQGASQTLKKTSCIYFEVTETNFIRLGYSTTDILNLLENEGFEIFRMNEVEDELLKISSSYVSEKPSAENLVAVRNLQDFESRTGWHLS